MKTAIIGYSGSGKSTLAGVISQKTGVDVLYIDKLHWLPGWVERDGGEKLNDMINFLDTHTDWVIDGTYKKLCFQRRMTEADEIIFMNFGRFSCLFRAVKRYRTYKGKTRESMTEGCDEKVDAAFLRWLVFEGRTKRRREDFENIVKAYPDKVTVIKNQRQLNRYMKEKGLL